MGEGGWVGWVRVSQALGLGIRVGRGVTQPYPTCLVGREGLGDSGRAMGKGSPGFRESLWFSGGAAGYFGQSAEG